MEINYSSFTLSLGCFIDFSSQVTEERIEEVVTGFGPLEIPENFTVTGAKLFPSIVSSFPSYL